MRCVCVWLGAAWVERGGGVCMRGLCSGFTNPVRTGGVLDICLCLDSGGVGGVDGELVQDLYQGLVGGVMSL